MLDLKAHLAQELYGPSSQSSVSSRIVHSRSPSIGRIARAG